MAAVHHVLRTSLIIVMAAGIVGIGAEELRLKTRRIKVSEDSSQRMSNIFKPDQDFRKAELAERGRDEQQKEGGEPTGKAQLKAAKESLAKSEHLDPTGLRGILHRLLP